LAAFHADPEIRDDPSLLFHTLMLQYIQGPINEL
jgi:hypothetical protein